mmetsp:Transcript_3884/g.9190  ORF Transcript_3884/g.9190 Transcript_3884/m.9190 type:complete len:213 (-) Transcript_3884:135-773(-)
MGEVEVDACGGWWSACCCGGGSDCGCCGGAEFGGGAEWDDGGAEEALAGGSARPDRPPDSCICLRRSRRVRPSSRWCPTDACGCARSHSAYDVDTPDGGCVDPVAEEDDETLPEVGAAGAPEGVADVERDVAGDGDVRRSLRFSPGLATRFQPDSAGGAERPSAGEAPPPGERIPFSCASRRDCSNTRARRAASSSAISASRRRSSESSSSA